MLFGKGFELFRVFDLPIRIDPSWFIVAALMTGSLSMGVFPALQPGLATGLYWAMGIVGALGLFASVVVHELSHSLVARRYGIPMRGITLFLFGGVAEMAGEPPSPRAELFVAAAGPAMSLAVSIAGLGSALLVSALDGPEPVRTVIGYLAVLNAVLALFNLIPAFPLDGGRILRSALWHWKGSLRQATRITSRIGSGFGFVLLAWGVAQTFWGGGFVNGLWSFLLGLFVHHAARESYRQLLLRDALGGEPVARFLRSEPVAVPRHISVTEMVEQYVYRFRYRMFPVVDDSGRLIGCVRTRRLRELPREEWDRQTAGAIAERCSAENTLPSHVDALRALTQMSRTGVSRLMVVEGDHLLGVLSLQDLLRFLSLKTELEEAA